MRRATIVRVLKETAALLELAGENPFRVRAYENAARTIEGLSEEPEELLERGALAELPGVGPGLVLSIAELVQSGRLSLHEELRRKYPPGLLDLFRVGGLGAKRIRVLHQELGVDSPAALERACRDGRVAQLSGFGAKSQARLLDGLAALGKFQERHLVSDALRAARSLVVFLESVPGVSRVEIAGSLRRACETIGDVDLVAAVEDEDRAAVAERFGHAPGVESVEASGASKVEVRLAGGLLAELRMVVAAEFVTALHHLTGSKEHNVALRTRALQRGLSISEHGVFRGEERLPIASEDEIYRALGLAPIAPELRENRGEIERAEAGPHAKLVERAELCGTFHVHTTWSDGTASLEAMAEAAGALGWEYLGIADHSQSAAYAGGLTPERVREQWAAIDAWNASGRRPWLFKGTECDILVDGALDFDDELLAGFDYVVVSVHSRFRIGREAMTARIVRAVEHPAVTFLGHPTGRLLLARDAYEVDLDAVLDAAERSGVVVELNASPHRLDLDWRMLEGWLARGCRTSIHPDAHSPHGLTDVDYGVAAARKAGATREQIVNCLPLDAVRTLFEARRERARRLLGSRAALRS